MLFRSLEPRAPGRERRGAPSRGGDGEENEEMAPQKAGALPGSAPVLPTPPDPKGASCSIPRCGAPATSTFADRASQAHVDVHPTARCRPRTAAAPGRPIRATSHAVEEVRRCRDELERGVPRRRASTRCRPCWPCRSATTSRCSSWRRSWASRADRAVSSSPNASVTGCAMCAARPGHRPRNVERKPTDAHREAGSRGPEAATPGQVPVASDRASCAERSLRRAAKVAACVRRSMPSFASRFET